MSSQGAGRGLIFLLAAAGGRKLLAVRLLSSKQRCPPIGGPRRRRRASKKPLYPGFYTVISGRRYYNPSTGRWLSRDPIGEKGGLNFYAFVHNEPVGRFDPLGLADNQGTDVSGIPDVFVDPNGAIGSCPTPLRNLIPFEIDLSVCGLKCTRQKVTVKGSVGDCYSTTGGLLGQGLSGLTSSSSTYFSIFCCCRNGKGSMTVKVGNHEFSGDINIDVDAYINAILRGQTP